jgi:hypothetical protein
MGTNYYARILPTKERRKELHDAIEANDYHLVKKLSDELYGRIELDYDTHEIVGGKVHLGKLSHGWKFLWNPNVFVIRQGHLEDTSSGRRYVPDPSIPKYLYPLTKQGLHDFIFREDVLVYDEYGEEQDKEEFWKDALEWGQSDGWDAASYEKEYKEHIYPVSGELTDLLRQEGYKFTSYSNSDFYSDGLRFAGYTDFS